MNRTAKAIVTLVALLVAPAALAAQTFVEQRDEIFEAFLAERSFRLVSRLADLPQDVRDLLDKHTDGTFAIAEQDEDSSIADGDFPRPGVKGASHFISGVSSELAVVVTRSGGFSVTTGIDIYDRRRGVGIHCVANSALAREWSGNNHTRELLTGPCWEVPARPCGEAANVVAAHHMQQGRELMGRNRLKDAESEFDLAIGSYDFAICSYAKAAEPYGLRAQARYMQENYSGAVEDLNKYLDFSPYDRDMLVQRGIAKSLLKPEDIMGACADLLTNKGSTNMKIKWRETEVSVQAYCQGQPGW